MGTQVPAFLQAIPIPARFMMASPRWETRKENDGTTTVRNLSFLGHKEQLSGECRFGPPVVVVDDRALGGPQTSSVWPTTKNDEWCGQWKPK